MASSAETSVQGLVHNLEHGSLASIIRRTLLIVAVLAVATIYIIYKFRGLEHGMGMDQAQIAREIARGHGFVTQTIRPLAVAQLEDHNKPISGFSFPDTYHAPLNPLVEAPLMLFVKSGWNTEAKNQEIIYAGDKLVAILALVFFMLAVTVNYFTARRLFDEKLAVIGTGLTLVCDMFWKYSMSGLPQMLMLLIFSGIVYLLVRAINAQAEGRAFGLTLSGIGVLFGLLLLTHGLTIWILLGFVAFVAVAFTPRVINALLVLAVALVIYSPWVVRNIKVSGAPFGVAPYSQLDEVKQSEAAWMRQPTTTLGISVSWFRTKISEQTFHQSGKLLMMLGSSLAAPMFFVSLLHRFKRNETAALRWALLSMWLFAFLGMTIAGQNEDFISPNQLHILFVPMMIFYGMAMLLILWSRLEIVFPYARAAFISVIFLGSSVQLILTLLPKGNGSAFVWPPYVPPIIAFLNRWMQPNEIIASDMPYAVAWYADRKSIWLPNSVEDFNALNDYNQLQMPINGLYLTPVTSRLGLFPNVAAGEYKEWSGLILRNTQSLAKFPLKAFVPLPLAGECIFYSDRDRWSKS
ncbi:MAG: glycosyltransferase family 39 protein [Chthoniobacterales bacterium]